MTNIILGICVFTPILASMYFSYVFNRDALLGWTTALLWASIAYSKGL